MAQTAWVAITARGSKRDNRPKAAGARVGAGVKELNEMTIGRTDDPENPRVATALEAASMFDWIADPIWASGHAAAPTGRTHDRNRSARQTSRFSSCTRGAVHTCNTVKRQAS